MSYTASDTFGHAEQGPRLKGNCGIGKCSWSALEVAAMVAGFVIFWPLGLMAMFLKWKKGEMWPGSTSKAPWSDWNWKMPAMGSAWGNRSYGFASSGNAAFDDYKRSELERLEAERRKLDEEQKAFAEHLANLRKARDKEEFDRFMAERNNRPHSSN